MSINCLGCVCLYLGLFTLTVARLILLASYHTLMFDLCGLNGSDLAFPSSHICLMVSAQLAEGYSQ